MHSCTAGDMTDLCVVPKSMPMGGALPTIEAMLRKHTRSRAALEKLAEIQRVLIGPSLGIEVSLAKTSCTACAAITCGCTWLQHMVHVGPVNNAQAARGLCELINSCKTAHPSACGLLKAQTGSQG